MPLLAILGISSCGTCCASDSSAYQRSPSGISIAYIVADNRSCEASNSRASEGSCLSVGSRCTAGKKEREHRGDDKKDVLFHNLEVG
tara:strand:+ start:462 stop:722 length:261 start_codon:yes stop_codon:yes gene_type:complete